MGMSDRIKEEVNNWIVPVIVMSIVALVSWGASTYQNYIANEAHKQLANAESIWLRDQLQSQIREQDMIKRENKALHDRIDVELRSYRREMIGEIKSIRLSLDNLSYRLQHEEKRNNQNSTNSPWIKMQEDSGNDE